MKNKYLKKFDEKFRKGEARFELVPNTPRKIMISDLDMEKLLNDIKQFISQALDDYAEEMMERVIPEEHKGVERLDCGDPKCYCGELEYTDYELGFNDCLEEIKENYKKEKV